jgi:hypothetical protein
MKFEPGRPLKGLTIGQLRRWLRLQERSGTPVSDDTEIYVLDDAGFLHGTLSLDEGGGLSVSTMDVPGCLPWPALVVIGSPDSLLVARVNQVQADGTIKQVI